MAGTLHITDVVKKFGAVTALNSVSLNIGSGQFMSFLGPSGCGKTTLLRVVAGFELPDRGEILLDGKSIAKLPPYERPIGMVFQNLALFPHLSVEGNLRFGLSIRGVAGRAAATKIAESLELVGLQGFEGRRMHQLSGGQRQRVALARALITEPAVLLLDEPLSALDLKLRRQLQGELKKLQIRTGTTFIFVTHDQEEAMAMSDQVAVFRSGEVEQVGSPQDIYRNPATRFVAEFVGDTNILVAEGAGGTILLQDFRITLPAPAHLQDNSRMLLSVRPENVTIKSAHSPGAIAANVSDLEFGGMTVRLSAQPRETSKPIRVAVAAEHIGDVRLGQTVYLGFDLSSAARLPEA